MTPNLTKEQLIQFTANAHQIVLNQYLELQQILTNYGMYIPVVDNLAKNAVESAKAIIDVLNANIAFTKQDIEIMKQQKQTAKKPFKNFQKQPQMNFGSPQPTEQNIPFNTNIHKDGMAQTELVQGNFEKIGNAELYKKEGN